MAKSNAELQAAYRARIVAQAKLFQAANDARRRALAAQMERQPSCAEEKHARQFFLNHPRCGEFPTVAIEDGRVHALFNESPNEFDMAAFFVAVREVSSIRVLVEHHADGKSAMFDSVDPFADQARVLVDEAATLRAAGLWGAL